MQRGVGRIGTAVWTSSDEGRLSRQGSRCLESWHGGQPVGSVSRHEPSAQQVHQAWQHLLLSISWAHARSCVMPGAEDIKSCIFGQVC